MEIKRCSPVQDQIEFGDNEKVTEVATNVQNEYVIKNSAVQVVAAPRFPFPRRD